jgi:hypothetical protein
VRRKLTSAAELLRAKHLGWIVVYAGGGRGWSQVQAAPMCGVELAWPRKLAQGRHAHPSSFANARLLTPLNLSATALLDLRAEVTV